MRNSLLLCLLLASVSVCEAKSLKLKWGLENTRSYKEDTRFEDEDGSIGSTGKAGQKKYRSFEFSNESSVIDPMLRCFDRHNKAWERYRKSTLGVGSQAEFSRIKAANDPFCVQNAKQQAPVLYFDFVGSSERQYVLERIEVRTFEFNEYKGGGFVEKEAWYDIVLSHIPGVKSYEVEPRLVFSGTGRAQLRFWSDNFYPTMGWMAPMGEYKLKITFVFSTDKGEEKVSTEIFKMDV